MEVHFAPKTLTDAVEEIIHKELGIEAVVYHDFDDVEMDNNYYLVIMDSELNEEEVESVENFFNTSIDSVYEMTLAIIDKLFNSYASNSYVKLIDSMLYDDSPIVVEFTPEDYKNFIKSN